MALHGFEVGIGGRRAVGGGVRAPSFRGSVPSRQALDFAHGQIRLDRLFGNRDGVVVPDERAGVTHRELSALDQVEHRSGQREQAHDVRDMAARFFDHLGEVGLRHPLPFGQTMIGARFLDCVEILSLQVLDESKGCDFARVELAHDGGNVVKAGFLRRAPPPFPGDKAVTIVTFRRDDDRLDDAARRDRSGEFGERILIEMGARLIRQGRDGCDRDRTQAFARRGRTLIAIGRRGGAVAAGGRRHRLLAASLAHQGA